MAHVVHVNPGAFGDAPAELLESAARAALGVVDEAELSVTLVDDEGIRELHRRYLGRDHVTDVLAFSLGGPGEVLGDVYVCEPQARRQAGDAGVRLDEELVRLVVHGTLHVLGHDHPEGTDRVDSPMFRLQERVVSDVLEARGTP